MGYTNFWTQYRDFTETEWLMIKDQYEYLRDVGEHHIFVDESHHHGEIAFNGIEGQECETFILEQQPFTDSYKRELGNKFNFCKTRQKPYDLVVWQLLTWINNKFGDSVMIVSRDRNDMTKLDVIDDPIAHIYESSISSPSSK